MNKIFFVSCLLILLTGCVQDSPNIKQIENLQFFIDNKSDNRVTEIESGLQYLVLEEEILKEYHQTQIKLFPPTFMGHSLMVRFFGVLWILNH